MVSGKSPTNLERKPRDANPDRKFQEKRNGQSGGPIETGLLLRLVHRRLEDLEEGKQEGTCTCDAVRKLKAGHKTEHEMKRKDHDRESGGPIETGLLLRKVRYRLQQKQRLTCDDSEIAGEERKSGSTRETIKKAL